MKNDDDTVNAFIIRRRAKRKDFSISHRTFRSYGEIKHGQWWFGDQKFMMVSSEKGLYFDEAIEWLERGYSRNRVVKNE